MRFINPKYINTMSNVNTTPGTFEESFKNVMAALNYMRWRRARRRTKRK